MTSDNQDGSGTPRLPLVSVLIRSMDRDTLAEALASVAQQTYGAIEVVVVNAGGRPHRALAGTCGRFTLRLVEGDGRPLARAAAANLALAQARGDWLLFLDDDDLIDADHIARLREALQQNPGSGVAYTGVRITGESGNVQGALDEPFDAARLWLANYLPIHAVMFARALVGGDQGFDESLRVYEDWDFWHRLARRQAFVHVPGPSASYRLIGQSGLSTNRDETLTHAARLGFYGKWLPRLQVAELEQLAARAEHARGDARAQADAVAAVTASLVRTQQDLATANAAAADLRAELSLAQQETARQVEMHAASVQLNAQLQCQMKETIAYQHHLAAQLRSTEQTYRQLEQGYRQITASLSWRITTPLRALRAATDRAELRRKARGLTRQVMLALPVAPATRQRIKVWLAASGWGSPLLRWLAPAPEHTVAPTQAPAIDKEVVRADAEEALTQFLASGQRLQFPAAAGAPRISVVVVLYNQAGLTLHCLQALAQAQRVDFETIIVDNASSDRMPALLERIDGARVLRQSENLGFLRAVNLAARSARGEHLLLLNNDAVVEPDTLASAVARLDADPRAGAVGGPILLWDGRLQEAGSIVWRDGSCLGYGRGQSPDAGPFRYLREVDYCSGAFLMIRRGLFESLGRFDDSYAPAYYEETDLCARLWEAGRSVVFDPKVRVKHFEFASDTGSGRAIALQARNRVRFAEKHPAFLAERPAPDLAHVLAARQRLRTGARRVLFIDDRVPMPWLGQGYPRAASFVAAIVASGDMVTHYPLQFPNEAWDDVYRALPESVEVMLDEGLAGIAAFLEARAGHYDVIVVSRPHNMDVISALRERHPAWLAGASIVYDAEALFSVRDITKAQVLGQAIPPDQQQQMIQAELALARGADRIVAVSEAEARHYRQAGFEAVHVLGHALDRRTGPAATAGRHGFLFVGAVPFDDSPNGDSLLWFVREVWPRVVQELGDAAVLHIVGPCESDTIRGLVTASIQVHGRVAQVAPFYDAARVFIVPTRYAAGIPHKAHEAAASGLPMVVTPLIAEQLGWQQEVQVAATPADFAAACIRLHRDEALWQLQQRRLFDAVERDCSPAAFHAAVAGIMGRAPSPKPV